MQSSLPSFHKNSLTKSDKSKLQGQNKLQPNDNSAAAIENNKNRFNNDDQVDEDEANLQ